MQVIHFPEAKRYEPEPNWMRVSLCNEQSLSIEHFVKPPRHTSPMHHHAQEQVLVVIRGQMKVCSADGEASVLGEGDSVLFQSNEPHCVENTLDEPSVGLDIFAPGRPFDFWLKREK